MPPLGSLTSSLPVQTSINRRNCARVVPMRVLVLGLPRTGTSSIQAALQKLGYQKIYHMRCLKDENPRDAEMWLDAFNRKEEGREGFGRKEWDALLGHCDAVTDMPAAFFAEDLIRAYPEAKVILSMRDFNSWSKSVQSTINRNHGLLFSLEMGFHSLFNRDLRLVRAMQAKKNALMYHGDFEANAGHYYVEHNARVIQACSSERLLVFRVEDGWEPFAKFLGKDVPEGNFPRENDRETWHRRFELRRRRDRKVTCWVLFRAFFYVTALTLCARLALDRLTVL